jgi:PleD family two-component response regulator
VGDRWLEITVSIGLTSSGLGALDVNGVLRSADEARFAAKRQGKNRLVARGALG